MSDLALKLHQKDAGLYLSKRPRALLTDPPGMMKTLSVIHGMALAGVKAPLIVCPAIVRTHWQRSFAEYHAAFPKAFSPLDVVVKSYNEIVLGGEHLQSRLLLDRDSINLDEFHYLKHSTSQRTRLLLGRQGYVRNLPVAWGTSGTPFDKNPTHIWTILSTFFPALCIEYKVPSMRAFVERFAVWELRTRHGKTYQHFFPVTKEPEVFKELLGRMWLRRENIVGVPVLWQTLRLDGSEHANLDYTINTPALKDAVASGNADALRAIAADPEVARARRRLGEHKAQAVVHLVKSDLEEGDEKIVLFAHHRAVLHKLRDELASFGVAYIDGDVPHAKRDDEVNRFISDPATRVFVGQNIACGTGMDGLQKSGARRMLLVEPDWSNVLNKQLSARLARPGQKHETVMVQMVALSGTLDEGIVRLNQREAEMLDGVGL